MRFPVWAPHDYITCANISSEIRVACNFRISRAIKYLSMATVQDARVRVDNCWKMHRNHVFR